MKIFLFVLFLFSFNLASNLNQNYLLFPMDERQNDHLKAYGIVYKAIEKKLPVFCLLNYKGGAFCIAEDEATKKLAILKNVDFVILTQNEYQSIQSIIKNSNMEIIALTKESKIAIYTPPNQNPWADAVTLVMTYAEIPYDEVYDPEVLNGKLANYDWLHLHHEDFTGQYSRFWYDYKSSEWMQEKVTKSKQLAHSLGYSDVSSQKKAVAYQISQAIRKGLFVFAMCSATETLDVALSTRLIDVTPSELDKTPVDLSWKEKIDYHSTLAFENFNITLSVQDRYYSGIDYNKVNTPFKKEVSDFILEEFSAKLDPIPTFLCQAHEKKLFGFYGQTTTFDKDYIKDNIIILANSLNNSARYITGSYGKGHFSFYGGHAPEDKSHFIGDQEPRLDLYKNSSAYRLILNNVLLPSIKTKKKKT